MSLVDLFECKRQHPQTRHVAYTPIKRAFPYAESGTGQYTHRVRSAALHQLDGYPPHVSISCWCGMSLLISGKRHRKTKFVPFPSIGRPLCATCEGRAIGAGLDSSHKINGRIAKYQPQIRGEA